MTTSAATLATAASLVFAAAQRATRYLSPPGTPNGILAYDWDSATGDTDCRRSRGTHISTVDWIALSPGKEYLYAACELDSFNGKPTGEVASFSQKSGELRQLSAQNSAGKGTCHVALDHTGHMLLSADYGGGSAASFQVTDGKLSPAVWTEQYTSHGPNADRQESAHAHFCSFSPDNRFAYINDLGGDMIHIYRADVATAQLTRGRSVSRRPRLGPAHAALPSQRAHRVLHE